MMTHDQAPDQTHVNPDWKAAVLHARISIGGTELLGADIPGAEPLRSAYLTLRVDSDSEAERIYATLGEGGRVLMAMDRDVFRQPIRTGPGSLWDELDDSPRATDVVAAVKHSVERSRPFPQAEGCAAQQRASPRPTATPEIRLRQPVQWRSPSPLAARPTPLLRVQLTPPFEGQQLQT